MVVGNARARLETEPVSVAVPVRQGAGPDGGGRVAGPRPAPGRFVTDAEAGQGDAPAAVTDAGKGSALRRLITGLGGAGALCLGYQVADPAGALAVLTRPAELLPRRFGRRAR